MSEILRKHGPAGEAVPERNRHGERTWSWPAVGWASGFLGAFVIALFFLVIDLAAGRPLWTPAALGSALFLGERLAPGAEPPLALVAGYTGIHLGIFAGLGLITATALSVRPRKRGPGALLVIGAALFVAFELSFLAFALLFAPSLIDDLGVLRITVANALAAAAMTAFLGDMATRLQHDG